MKETKRHNALFVQLEKEQDVYDEDTGGFAEMGSQLSRSQKTLVPIATNSAKN